MLGPIRRQAPPPTFVWCTRSLFEWQPYGLPEIGEMWYGPWSGTTMDSLGEMLVDYAEPFAETIAVNLTMADLPARVRAVI
jgi:hypothetical protein